MKGAIVASRKFNVDGINVDTFKLSEASRRICDEVEGGSSFSVYTINLDHVVKLRSNAGFRRAYEKARIVLADGFPIVLAGRLQGHDVERTPGSDLIDPLCDEAGRRGISVVLVGATFEALRAAARELKSRYPALSISGVYAPPANFDVEGSGAQGCLDFIRQSGAQICLLALGAPKQEIFAERCAREIPDGVSFICIGAGLDFIAGSQKRAPKLFQKLGCEWLWRLLNNPRRLARRYAECMLVFPGVVFGGLLKRV